MDTQSTDEAQYEEGFLDRPSFGAVGSPWLFLANLLKAPTAIGHYAASVLNLRSEIYCYFFLRLFLWFKLASTPSH